MSLRWFLTVSLLASLAACSPRARITAGAITTIVGGATYVVGGNSYDSNADPITLDLDKEYRKAGLVMIVTGAVLIASGLFADEPTKPPAPVPVEVKPEPPTVRPIIIGNESTLEHRLAVQTSVAANRGACVAARATGKRLHELDPSLHAKLLAADRAYAACVGKGL